MTHIPAVKGLTLLVLSLSVAAMAAETKNGGPTGRAEAKSPADAALVPLPRVPSIVSELLQDRNYAGAVKAIDEAAKAKDAPRDYLAYLKGRALHLSGQFDAAVEQFTAMEKEFPKSDWARRARFGKAVALARKGDFRSAELIYRKEVEYLLSATRKQEIADLYLEFADSYFKPKDEVQHKPDYQRALDFYLKALEVGPQNDRRDEIELQTARCYQLLNQLPEAAKRYAQFVKDHPDSKLIIEARFRLGETQLAQNQPEEARRTWQDLLAAHGTAKSERIAEAAYNLSLTYGIPNPQSDENLALGVAALETFLKNYPDHKLAPQAHLRIAESYIARGRYEDAVKSLTRFLADPKYSECEELADARNLLGRSYQLQRKWTAALEAWRDYLAKHPAHRAWSEVQREIVNTEFYMAADKAQAKQYDEARKLWSAFLAKYPLDPRDPGILYAFGLMDFQQEKFAAAIDDWRRLVSKYPGTDDASRGQYMIAVTLETKLGKLDDALKEYKKVESGSYCSHAQVAIARLTAKSMAIATERIFRSDETPTIRLTSRNIESVTVRAYKVDLETYFRKMHNIQGVEGLDISLIDPDKTFEFKVPKYAEYQELESQVELPLFKALKEGEKALPAGAWAVTVSSKTLEATTLVLQSDLDLIVKSSRDELFVFAENMRTGKPWAGAKLLISNGQQVFAEAATGADGVFKQSYKELKDAGDVRVFALADGCVASNLVSLNGVGVAQGLSDKGYLYTDRPAYRAGQLVHVRGVLRRAVDDNYTIEKGKKYTLDVFDARSRSIWQEDVKLSDFGSFHIHFLLPATSPVGDYRVVVHDDDGRSYQGGFQVHEYQLEPVRLTVETDRRVFYRGEQIEGTIRAAFYYGAPLAGREITYQLAGGRSTTAKTDEKGEVQFKFPTRDFDETQTLPLVVTLPERNLRTTQNFFLATQGFSFSLSTVRPVFVAGETFEVTVKATNAEGKPLAQKLVLKVLERTVVDGKVGESEIEQHELATDAKDGTVRQALRLEKGAQYILRAEGIDRFKNPVSGQHVVGMSDDKDQVRLRILADKHTFKVGDTAEVQLHWREAPALALVTFQGARVLDYKLVQLEKGANKFTIPMSAKLAPNFNLSVSVMTDASRRASAPGAAAATPAGLKPGEKPISPRRFHEAVSPFTVERQLRITLKTKRKADAKGSIRSGEDVELSIKATDPQGKPVSAELSIGMVEQALLSHFSANSAPIDDFFRGIPRESALRTSTSVTFAYSPATHSIDRHLLNELERQEIAKEEAEHAKSLQLANDIRKQAETLQQQKAALVQENLRIGDFAARGAGANQAQQYGASFTKPSIAGRRTLVTRTDDRPANQDQVDFDSLTDLITSTIKPNSWSDAGGSGSVAPFETNLSLTVSQTQEIHDGQGIIINGGTVNLNSMYGSAATGALATPDLPKWEMLTRTRAKLGVQVEVGGQTLPSPYYAKDDIAYFPASPEFQLSGEHANGFLAESNRMREISIGQLVTSNNFSDSLWGDRDGRAAIVLSRDGTQTEWSIGLDFAMPEAQRKELSDQRVAQLQKLVAERAIVMPQRGPLETGYWKPAIVTDEKGEASVTITMPDQSTAWDLAAKGISGDTLAGEAKTELTVKKDLFGELKLPTAFTDGDDAQILATVHNSLIEKGQIQVTLKTTIGSKTTEEKRTIDVAAKGLSELSFPAAIHLLESPPRRTANKEKTEQNKEDSLKAELQQEAIIELTVTSGKETDVIRRVVPIHPFGMPVYATSGGSASADTTVWVEAPAQMSLVAPSLQILVGPTIERSLLDVLFGPAAACQFEALQVASGIDSTTSDLLAALALQKLLGTTRDATGPNSQALDARVRSSISLLVSSQQDDGGWSWTGQKGTSHRLTSARAVWALSQAKSAGYKVADDRLEKALTYLQSQVAATAETDYESKAILLQALAAAGRSDFTLANRLYRNRPALSSGALANLALALAEMDHKPMAEDLLALLAQRNLDDAPTLAASATANLSMLPWGQSSTEIRALYALALEEVTPDSPKLKVLIDGLMSHRTGHRWSPDKATGPATAALARWFGKARFDEAHYKLTIIVNDLEVKTLDIDSKTGSLAVDVPARMLKPGKQRVNFQLTGRGRYTFQAILSGFVEADKLKNTTQNWTVKRHYEPAPLEFDGKETPRGFGVLQGSYSTFRNPLTQLPVGRRGHVELEIWRNNIPANASEEQVEYLVVTEPLPSGATVIENSIAGGFERYEINPGSITFYIGGRAYVDPIRFDVHGYLAGDYRAAPTVIRNAYRPDQMAAAAPEKLAVLPLGSKSADPYRLTPQELYELGKRHFEKKDLKQAGANLGELIAKWNVNPDVYKDAARMLLDIHLETGPPAEIVRYFEIIKEKWPELEFPFEKIIKVAAAYHEIGEYERSYLVFRSTAESSFIRETAVAGFLEGQGEFVRSIGFMNRLLAEYPPEPYVAAATFALSQRVYAKAPKAADDPKLREKKINRVDLISQALAMLENFLTDYPDDPAADQAAFSEANALLELKAYKDVIARATKFAARYPKSDYLDSFWYIVAFGHFALGEHEQALDMAKKVAEAKRIDKQTGREVDSPNKWEAIYIMGQVYHSLGKAAQAIAEYTRVEDRFADAKQAIAYFTRQEISLPEVTTIRPTQPAELELKFRNVAAVDTKLYRIDLMKFGLLKRNLAGITQINLAGIRPFFETRLELGDGRDYRDRTHKLTLPLKEEGAYLLVCRGGDLYASGLVLVSPLSVEVQEDAPSGQVRVTVKNVNKDAYVSEVQAKVIGSRNDDFVSGATDLRGVFVAQGVRGTSTVIAETDAGRYAFFRGNTELGPQPKFEIKGANEPAAAEPPPPGDKSGNGQPENNGLLDNLQLGNGKIQQQNSDSLEHFYKENKGGVKAKEAY